MNGRYNLIFRNTTDIPDKLVALAVTHALDGLTPRLAEDGIKELVIKNKAAGRIRGQWGWFFSARKRVVVIVPRVVPPYGISGLAPYSKRRRHVASRAEFLVMVVAHEIRHAWQWAEIPPMRGQDKEQRYLREIDAEAYEAATLRRWREKYGEVTAASRG